ncbi:bifunctional helix-turn-helix domain-containing protein/methylated-DNA--[protein]-cysteine S-methyltransferase [Flavisolibacter ginsenosidimutans]|uniref:methylated-DNA--[protein]-cysteine S-methyltransferase n=1 Tax=Flavisolibacter ginsenosidimutans TaxID=661481 RepID=A0A5B8UL45_9BACT|nr:methylated-DNA--[protein]-cysteine S-methyltransferase [Flavisolibacter ginsenosidimutans]QEC56909.1 methylated-DNA--[protein]-cysteine S-methyltransferase [Flavisolibacter ginsenosidimutans]
MQAQEQIDYHRIAEAINYIRQNFKEQPTLEAVAEKVFLSPYHFQRLFSKWAGTTPKKFLQYTSIEYAKQLLKEKAATLFDAAHETGLSGTSRLHDLFVTIEGMTPAEYKNGGKNLFINYSFADSPFGNLIVASTFKGVCYMAFQEDEAQALNDLKSKFPNASFSRKLDLLQQNALFIFQHDWSKLNQIKLHLRGTDFQLKVWETLLKIPSGKLTTYGAVANKIAHPAASRAVGTAIGSNPVAYLIPCHRVIQSSGAVGGYMWGSTRKTAMIGWEAALSNQAV